MAATELLGVSVVGEDRPGIVAGITKVLYEHGCNLEDATSTILRGHFAMMLVVRAPRASIQALQAELDATASRLGLIATARALADVPARPVEPTHMIAVYGADRPGIVYRVAELLADRDINITDLTSRVIGSDAEPVYALMLEVVLHDDAALQPTLASLGDELGVDISVHPIEADLL